jgi:acetyl esterase/lipase
LPRPGGHHLHPAQIHDLKEVVRWMRAHSTELGLDPARIAAFG